MPAGVEASRLGAGVAEQADATVSKTVEGKPSCRFDPDLRHGQVLSSSAAVAQRTLDPLTLVRIQARQPVFVDSIVTPD